jgi:hypothetical protein
MLERARRWWHWRRLPVPEAAAFEVETFAYVIDEVTPENRADALEQLRREASRLTGAPLSEIDLPARDD